MCLWTGWAKGWKTWRRRMRRMKASESLAYSASETVIGWRLFLKTILARAYPRIIGQQREKSWTFFEIFKMMRFTKREPTLEDVFMDRVGQRMEDVEKEDAPNEGK